MIAFLHSMNVTLISIGDELLTGRTVNTNAAWLGQQLASAGHPVETVLTIRDNQELISKTIAEAASVSDFVVVTGGLGPTDDDVTREAVADLLQCEIVVNEEQLELIHSRFASSGRVPNERSLLQARVPVACNVILNHWGTAPGLSFLLGTTTVLVLPGVPAEMTELFKVVLREYIQPAEGFGERVWLLYGVPESVLAQTLEPLDDVLDDVIGLAYLPSQGTIRLRLVRKNADSETLERFDVLSEQIEDLAGKWIVSRHNETLWQTLGRELLEQKCTIATAESCTGGMIGAALTSIGGSSGYVLGGIISYANEVKETVLGVRRETLETHGAVSEQVALEMAKGVRNRIGSDYAIAVTGIAGPGGGSPEKPVGTVWIGVASEMSASAKLFHLKGEREVIRRYAVNAALAMVLLQLRKEKGGG